MLMRVPTCGSQGKEEEDGRGSAVELCELSCLTRSFTHYVITHTVHHSFVKYGCFFAPANIHKT